VKFVGDRLLRKEDPRLVQGQGRYVGDITLPGMLHAAIVRSPHAHARIAASMPSRALEAPGVAGVVTFADLGEAARPFAIVPLHAALRGKNFPCWRATARASSARRWRWSSRRAAIRRRTRAG
jgi:CO/xanthine dehydrogenase Mo-binding subunit